MKGKKDCAAQGAPLPKKEKAKEKGQKMKEKMAAKRRKMKGGAAVLVALGALALAGCQAANPASRSNRTNYGITVSVRDSNGVDASFVIGDGTYADASGGGDTQSNSPTQTTDTKPEVAVGVGGGSAGTGGAKPSSGIVGEALNKLMGIFGGSGQKLTSDEAAAIRDCVDGNCSD